MKEKSEGNVWIDKDRPWKIKFMPGHLVRLVFKRPADEPGITRTKRYHKTSKVTVKGLLLSGVTAALSAGGKAE